MSDRPAAKPDDPDPPAGVAAKRQLVFPDAVARDNQVRSRIPLVAEAPVFEFEVPPEPPQAGSRLLPRRWRMRLRRFWMQYAVWFVMMLIFSVAVVVVVTIFSPPPKPTPPPVRR